MKQEETVSIAAETSNRGRRQTDREPVNGWFPTLAVGIGVALLDWVSKALVAALLPDDHFVELVPGWLAVWHVRNPAMILGV